MVLFENIFLAFRTLKANPLRSILILTGMAVGIAAVLHVVALGEVTQRKINKRLASLGSNVLQIRPNFSRRRGVRTETSVVSLKWEEAKELVDHSEVITATVPLYSGSKGVQFRDKNWNTRVVGTTPEYEFVNNEHLVEGRFFNQDELNRRSRVCVLGATVHEKLFGDRSPIGETIFITGKRYLVVGTLKAKGESWRSPDDQVFIPLTTAQQRLFGIKHVASILAQIRSADDYDEALFEIETTLRRNHRIHPEDGNDFRVRRQDFFLATIKDANKELGQFIMVIALVSLVVGGIGIANVMLISVTERIREIGIRRAIGAKKIHILTQFMTESIILGLLGGVLGIIGGIAFNQYRIGEGMILPMEWIAYSFMICAGIGTIAGIYPALRAANRNVIDSLRYE